MITPIGAVQHCCDLSSAAQRLTPHISKDHIMTNFKDFSGTPSGPGSTNGGNGNPILLGPSGPGGFGPGMPSAATKQGAGIEDLLIDYNDKFKGADQTLFRDDVIAQTLSVLIGKNKPNPLLVGPAGVGKTRIVEDIARRIANNDPLIPKKLAKHTIYELPLTNIIAGAGIVGELESRLQALIAFATDPKNNAIIFIDEAHMLSGDRSETYTKIGQILKPAMARGDIHLIGATTTTESRDLDNDPAFARRFTRLIVDEFDMDQTRIILENALPGYLMHYGNKISVPSDALDSVVKMSEKFKRAEHHRPDNALTLLDRAMAEVIIQNAQAANSAQISGNTQMIQLIASMNMLPLTEKHIESTARRLMTGNAVARDIDIDQIAEKTAQIIGQDEPIGRLLDALERDDIGLTPRTRPMAWLLAGTSGTGKSETAKIIARTVTGLDPIILNMTEFKHESSTARIIGAPPGYVGYSSNAELPFDPLEANPHRVILLDELEKADKAVQRLFLSAIDEGTMTDSRGKSIDFSKAIIIATTNAGREITERRQTGFQVDSTASLSRAISHSSLITTLERDFDPEFLARFSTIVAFNGLDASVYRDILVAAYDRSRAVALAHDEDLDIPDELPDDVLDHLVAETYLPSQGARPAQRAVDAWIEDQAIAQRRALRAQAAAFIAASDDDDDDHEDESNDTQQN